MNPKIRTYINIFLWIGLAIGIIYFSHLVRESNEKISTTGTVVKLYSGQDYSEYKNQRDYQGENYFIIMNHPMMGYGTVEVDVNTYYTSYVGETINFKFSKHKLCQIFDYNCNPPLYQEEGFVLIMIFLYFIGMVIFWANAYKWNL